MVSDEQVRQLRKLLAAGETLQRSAWKTGMAPKTARKYRSGMLPSERNAEQQRTWRTREDAFEDVWPKVQELLDESPELEAKTIFAWLQ